MFNVDLDYVDISALMDLHMENGSSPEFIRKLFNEFVCETRDSDHFIFFNNEISRKHFEMEFKDNLLDVIKYYNANDPFITEYTVNNGKDTVVESVSSIWEVIQGDLEDKFREWLSTYNE